MKQATGTEALARVRQMRTSLTEAERLIRNAVRGRRLGGFKFRRQVWIGTYIADFLCAEARLVIELDGSQLVRPKPMTRIGMQAWPKQAIERCASGTMT